VFGPRSLERRLFGWMLALTLVPGLLVLAAAVLVGGRSLSYLGTLGPWEEVASTGRAVFQAADSVPAVDPALAEALDRHREGLSSSVVQASRWQYLNESLLGLLPWIVGALALLLSVAALVVSRILARQLARPIGELVAWADLMARDQPLPGPGRGERREVREVAALRRALRGAAERIGEGRARALESERVRAWGEMARRLAHEMKNPLTPLRLAAHRVARAAAEDPRLDEPAAVINEETARLQEMAAQFAALGRPPAELRSEVDLAELARGLLASDVPPGIDTELLAGAAVPRIAGDYDALVRAFRNLLRNAVQALTDGDGGAARRIRMQVAEGNLELVVRVEDSGPGVPRELAERIFEPDYTLRAGGTGLGLAVVRQVVAGHGGSVEVAGSELGGAAFTVRLPVRPPGALHPTDRETP
jgi:nitrogen fixation/metabolism regulation signal transduction histidine kinase